MQMVGEKYLRRQDTTVNSLSRGRVEGANLDLNDRLNLLRRDRREGDVENADGLVDVGLADV